MAELTQQEAIDRRIARAYKPHWSKDVYFNSEVTRDAIVHFLDGIGDTNPLFRREEYARKSNYKGAIAPGSFLYSVQWMSNGIGIAGKGSGGTQPWFTASDWEFFRPIQLGAKIRPVNVLLGLDEKTGKMGGGKTWLDHSMLIYVTDKSEILAREKCICVFAERQKSGAAKKYVGEEYSKHVYSDAELKSIYDLYDKEEIRGAKARYWEDVEVGEELPTMVRGPLSMRDMIAWVIGAGGLTFKAHGLYANWERKHPNATVWVEALKERDTPELVHFVDEYARLVGVDHGYDFGCERISWLYNYFSNWIGDAGFLWKMKGEMRKFNMKGDTQFFHGKVVAKHMDNGKCCVDIEAWTTNQREQQTIVPGISTVILPSKKYGPVVYPEPDPDVAGYVKNAKELP